MWTFRNRGPALKKSGVFTVRANFRVKLLVAMMLMVSAITATALYFAQRGMEQMCGGVIAHIPR